MYTIVCIHQLAPTLRNRLHWFSVQNNQKLRCIRWMCRCRREERLWLICDRIRNSNCNWCSPWEVYVQSMRQHLYQCLLSGELKMFPTVRERRGTNRIKCKDNIEVFYSCRMPEMQDIDMVECCQCREWYHVPCVRVPQEELKDRIAIWFCDNCN